MTPQILKFLMEQQWAIGGCAQPLYPPRWRISSYGASHQLEYRDPFVLDEDKGGPLDPPEPGDS